jgi:hypothetical protein
MSDPILLKLNATMIDDRAISRDGYAVNIDRKWPVWIRLLVIGGIAAALWTLIISGAIWALS